MAGKATAACRLWLMETRRPHVYIVICVHERAGGGSGGSGEGGLKQLLN